MTLKNLLKAIKEHNAEFIDLRFTDTIGKEQHVTITAKEVTEELINTGKMVDGSSFKGWQKIHVSDLSIVPNLDVIRVDPFFQDSTIVLRCDVIDPETKQGYERCPRAIAKKAEKHLKNTGIADEVYFGPEPEFFIFDEVYFESKMGSSFYQIDSEEAHWNSGNKLAGGNSGHRPGVKGGYFPVPPVDSSQDIRSAISKILQTQGIPVEAHHHEVATANQCEIATNANTLVKKADEVQVFKYVVHNVAQNHGKTATFMPKPLVGDNGNGMHCHQSLFKDGQNIFAGDKYAGLSEIALFYIGGIIKHAKSLNAFTNPATNSYKRLVPGFEAPVLLSYAKRNRSAAIRVPHFQKESGARVEVRFPDGAANPYLAFSAMMLAGLDGINNKIHPGDATDQDLYTMPDEVVNGIPKVASSLEHAILALKEDNSYLREGDVFTPSFLESYIALKEEEITQIRRLVHPYEFELYYSC